MGDAMNGIGKEIRRIRLNRDWMLHDLAAAIGLSDSMVSLIENGKRVPSWPTLQRIAKALDREVRVTLRRGGGNG